MEQGEKLNDRSELPPGPYMVELMIGPTRRSTAQSCNIVCADGRIITKIPSHSWKIAHAIVKALNEVDGHEKAKTS